MTTTPLDSPLDVVTNRRRQAKGNGKEHCTNRQFQRCREQRKEFIPNRAFGHERDAQVAFYCPSKETNVLAPQGVVQAIPLVQVLDHLWSQLLVPVPRAAG